MLEALFSFGGRLGRAAYFGWNVAAIILVAVAAFVLGFVGALALGPAAGSSVAVVVGVGVGLVGIWMSLALTAKRFRDMGFTPWIWIVGISAVLIVDQFLLTHYIKARLFPPFQHQTPIGVFVATASFIMLLLWPPADEEEAPPSGANRRLNWN